MRYNYKDKSINVIGTKEHIQGRINSYKRDEPKTVRWIVQNIDKKNYTDKNYTI